MKAKIHAPSLVSIITRAYNVEKYIDECVKSVLKQTYPNFEWILLDNGSTDETNEKLKNYARKDARIRLFRNPKNFNSRETPPEGYFSYFKLLQQATGNYVTDLDSDDFLAPTFLEEMIAAKKNADVDVVACGTAMFYEGNPDYFLRNPPAIATANLSDLGDNFPEYYNVFRPVWGKLFKRSFYFPLAKNYFETVPDYLINGSDTYMCLQILQTAKSLVCIEKPLYYHRLYETSIYYSNFYEKRYLGYGLLHKRANQLLRSWKKDTEENTIFINLVHFRSMQDCLDVAKNSNAGFKECLSFLHNICKDSVLLSYYNFLPLEEKVTFENQIFDLVDRLSNSELTDDDTLALYQSYLYRFLPLRNASGEVRVGDILRYFSVVFDEQNKLKFGFPLFEQYVQPLFPPVIFQELKQRDISRRLCFCSAELIYFLVNNQVEEIEELAFASEVERLILSEAKQIFRRHGLSYDSEQVNKVKSQLSQELEAGNIDEIIRIMVGLGTFLLFDYDLLQIRTQLYLMSDDKENAVICSLVGQAFFKDDNYFSSVLSIN